MCYTQNIDTLERIVGVPDEVIVEAHGSFADQHCIECGSQYEGIKLKGEILRGEIAHCYQCGGLIKPDIVFFGEAVRPVSNCESQWQTILTSADSYLPASTRPSPS